MEAYTRYPAGPFEKPESFDPATIAPLIDRLEKFPSELSQLVLPLKDNQRAMKTLPGIWTIAQVVNHLADSHMNAFIRIKLTLTEDTPTVKPYKENLWAGLADGSDTYIEHSLAILDGVHSRMALVLRSLDLDTLNRTYYHPEYKSEWKLWQVLALYAWHGSHHIGFIRETLEKKR